VGFNLIAALIGGLIGTVVMTLLMMVAPMMGMPAMDIPALLGSMFRVPGNKVLGLILHLMMGMIFGMIYGLLFSISTENMLLLGLSIGNVHWLIVGLVLHMLPTIHAGIRSGQMSAPGIYMVHIGGVMGFLGGLIGHVVYGLVVALVYGSITGGFVGG
jgi:hypothetical protein